MKLVPVLVLFLSAPALAQDINIDFGAPPAPASTYGAASGQAGVWNSVVFPSGVTALVDIAGNPTSVTIAPQLSMACDTYACAYCAGAVCPGMTGTSDDQRLLGTWIDADCGALSTAFGIGGFEGGRYALYVYSYGCPSNPLVSTNFHIGNLSAGTSITTLPFQGSWTGFPVGHVVFQIPAGGSFNFDVMGAVESGIAGLQIDKLDPTGTPGCFGDGSGAACPCANSGQPGQGCRNSASINGALLGAVGQASLGFDTLGFECTFLPPNVAGILVQGSQLVAPIAFGDGLRCVGGSLKRLYLANADATGALALPLNSWAFPVSVRSAALGDVLAPGAVRSYQHYYRDNNASWCPAPQGSNFNISNAVTITWQP